MDGRQKDRQITDTSSISKSTLEDEVISRRGWWTRAVDRTQGI